MHKSVNLSLQRKLFLLVGFFLMALLMVGAIGISHLRQVSASQSEMYSGTVVPLRVVVDGGRQAAVHFRRMYPYMLKPDAKSRDETRALNARSQDAVQKAVDYLVAEAPTPAIRQIGVQLKETWQAYLASATKLCMLADSGDVDAAMAELKASTDPLHVKVRDMLVEAGKQQEAHAQASAEAVTKMVDRTAVVILIVIAMVTLIGGIFGHALMRSVLAQLGGEPASAVQAARNLAEGDLRQPILVESRDTSSLMFQLSQTRQNLASLIGQVQLSAETVASAAGEISAGTQDLSMRTEQQASTLEATAASMAQLGTVSHQNSDNARLASEMSAQASTVAAQAGKVVAEVVETMKGINNSSAQITEIIGVIDGIAFQTNILALNAAVEAARAGEQGRGFAVVASEVRALAQRSANAARQVKTLITASSECVEHGSTLVDCTGTTVVEVVKSIRRVSDIVAEISAASSEQSDGVRRVGDSVQRLDHATQQNAALVEQSAAASESLRMQAMHLVQAVKAFQIA